MFRKFNKYQFSLYLILCLILNVNAFAVKKRQSNVAEVAGTTILVNENTKNITPEKPLEFDEKNDNYKTHTQDVKSNLLKQCDPCPKGIICVPQIQCPAHVRMKDFEKPQICDLPGGKFGFCCLTGQNHTAHLKHNPTERMPMVTNIPMEVVEEARRKFEQLMHKLEMTSVPPSRPDFAHSIVFHSTPHDDAQNFHLSNSAMEQVISSQILKEKEQIPVDDIITNNIEVEFTKTPLARNCDPPPLCHIQNVRYRSIDGTCNNPLPFRTHWGAAGQAMERLLPPAYEDGIWTPRIHSIDGSPLMGAREISRILLKDINRPHPKYNLLIMQFGQFIAHDVTQSSSVRLEGGELVECCTPNAGSVLPPNKRHYACMPIAVEADDEFFKDYHIGCMNFVRLSLASNSDCRVGYGKQRSKVTHFLDASPVYGSSVEAARELRTFVGGRLKMFNDFGRDLLPLTQDKTTCDSEDPKTTCFKSGDGRTNQIISLIAVHILLAREHNRIADALARMNPHFSDELLFQESRRILIAEMQHIIYNEYLPSVIGPMQMKRFRLVPQHHGYSNDYNADVNPAITNEFSGAAFRMGHSSVAGQFYIKQDANNIFDVVNIPEVMFNPRRMRNRTFYDNILRTMMMQPMQMVDSSITYGLSRFLFQGHNPFGLDLAAFNIQRGRDQGLRCYNDYLEVMGHRKIQSFEQLPEEVGKMISKVYRHPDDIDLWIGGLLEKAIEDGMVGVTFAEIIADQFSRFKQGDRYFYEYGTNINPGGFSMDQLHEIRKSTMARLLCDNADHLMLTEVPPAAFIRGDVRGNEPIRCDSPLIPVVDLEAWRF